VQVQFVGSGDTCGSGGRLQTCIRLTAAGQTLLVDCGATSLVGLKAQRIDPSTIDAVVVTHLHGDHFGGLPFLVLDGQFSRRSTPLVVAGPPGTRARLAEAMEVLFPGSTRVQRCFPLEVVELALDGTPVNVHAVTVRAWEVEHACGAPPLAVNVALGGSVFAYSGDTQWTPALIEASRGADLFAVEAYTYDRSVRYHLDYRTLREHAHEITAARTIFILSVKGTAAWVVALVAAAVARRRNGAARGPVVLPILAGVFLLGGHPFPSAPSCALATAWVELSPRGRTSVTRPRGQQITVMRPTRDRSSW